MAWSHEQGTGCLLRLICFGSRIPLKSEQVWKIFNGRNSPRANARIRSWVKYGMKVAKWPRSAGFPSATSSTFSGKPDGHSARGRRRRSGGRRSSASLLAAEAFCRLICVGRYTPGCREGRLGNVLDHRDNLLGDDVMNHVPGIGHLTQRTLRQFRAQPPGLAVGSPRSCRRAPPQSRPV